MNMGRIRKEEVNIEESSKSGVQKPFQKRGEPQSYTSRITKELLKMKRKANFIIIIFISLFLFTSCKLSTNELAQEVRYSIEETWEKENITGIAITAFTLTHKKENEYAGLLETIEDGERYIYSVEVIYDGENMQWAILN